jgi:hypothetical protein
VKHNFVLLCDKFQDYQGHQVPENQHSWKTWASFLPVRVKKLLFWQLIHPLPPMEVHPKCCVQNSFTDQINFSDFARITDG